MIQITLSEIYRFFKSKSQLVTMLLMILLIVLLSLLAFNNMGTEGNAVLRFMNNAVVITEAKLSAFMRLIFESGIFTFFTGISFVLFRARIFNTNNIQNIMIEAKSKYDIILSSFSITFLFALFEFIIIFFGLMIINSLFGFENNLYETFSYLSKQFICQYAYLMLMDVILDYTQSNLIAIIVHFILSSGLFYSIVGICSNQIGGIDFYKLCLSYNFLMLTDIKTCMIVIISICYLVLVIFLKYIRYVKMGEFK